MEGIESADVRTGFANVLANKGAVGISFKIRGNSFLFISSHLTGKNFGVLWGIEENC